MKLTDDRGKKINDFLTMSFSQVLLKRSRPDGWLLELDQALLTPVRVLLLWRARMHASL